MLAAVNIVRGTVMLMCAMQQCSHLFFVSKVQGAWHSCSYPLASKARAGANGTKIFLLPLFPYMVHLPVIVARCLVYM